MRVFITFGDEKYAKTRDFAARMAKLMGGFDKVVTYTPEDIDEGFKKNHDDIFSIKRGYGLWLWKPYLIYKALNEICQEGDYLFYSDGGAFFFRSVSYIEKVMGDSDMWISCVPLKEWQFTKQDTFDLMGCHGDKYEKTPQVQGTFLYIRKTPRSIAFIKEWLDLCCDIRLLHPDNVVSHAENKNGFHGHREDQSILSLLCKMKGQRVYQDPTQYSRFPEKYWRKGFERALDTPKKQYPPIIILHRTANLNISDILRQIILLFIPRWIGLKLITYDKNG